MMSDQKFQELLERARTAFDDAADCDRAGKNTEACQGYSRYLNLLDELGSKDEYLNHKDHYDQYVMLEARSVTEERVQHFNSEQPITDGLHEQLQKWNQGGFHDYSCTDPVNQDQEMYDSFEDQDDDFSDECVEDLPPPPPPPLLPTHHASLSSRDQHMHFSPQKAHQCTQPGAQQYRLPPPPVPKSSTAKQQRAVEAVNYKRRHSSTTPSPSDAPTGPNATYSRQPSSHENDVCAAGQSGQTFSVRSTWKSPSKERTSSIRQNAPKDNRKESQGESHTSKANGHKIDQKTKEVAEKVLQEPRSKEAMEDFGKPKGRIVLKGCKNIDDGTLIDYFESRRRGWGVVNVESITRDPSDDDIALIVFPSMQVVDRILSKENHQIQGKMLTLSEYKAPREKHTNAADTICVSGYGDLHDDTLSLYFGNPRSGGGEIVDITRHQSEGIVYIKFKDPSVAEKVAQKESHSFQNEQLVVTLYTEHEQDQGESINKLAVSNYGNLTDDTLQIYFENRKIGGPVEDIQRNEADEIVYVTFKNKEDMHKVLQKKSHEFSNHILQVFIPAVKEKKEEFLSDTVMVNGHGNLTVETLQIYFENQTDDGEIKDIWKTEMGDVCITFKCHDDFTRVVAKKCHRIQGCELEVTPYSVSAKRRSEATISVSGYGNLSDDILSMYFESSKNKGGNIKHIRRDDDEAQVIITFEEPEAAASVLAKKDHQHDGNQLTVSRYVQALEEKISATIVITGFGNLSDDTIAMYFENKRIGGGEVKEVQRSQDGDAVIITFLKFEDADYVSKKIDHVLDGYHLKVSLLMNPPRKLRKSFQHLDIAVDDKDIYVLQVKGVQDRMTEEWLQLYFENRRKSGGGDVDAIELDRDTGTALIYFQKGDVVQRVLQKAPHRYEGANLEVSAYLPAEKACEASHCAWLRQQREGTVLEVIGCRNISKDTMSLYFENRRRSGGEANDLIRSNNDDVFYLAYQAAEDVTKVASKQHVVRSQNLKTKLYKPPVVYEDRFCFTGLHEGTSEADVIKFFESKTGWSVTDVTFSQCGEKAIVTVDTSAKKLDVMKVANICHRRPLKGAFLDVVEVPVSRSIRVQDLCPTTIKSTLSMYFESKRSGNTDEVEVEEVELDDAGTALVHFKDHRVKDKVLRRKHRVDKADLTVASHNECLWTSRIELSRHPTSVTVDKLNKYAVRYIRESKEESMTLEQQLSDISCSISWISDSSAMLSYTSKGVQKETVNVTAHWKKNVVSNFTKFLSGFSAAAVDVLRDMWPEVKNQVLSLKDSDSHDHDIYMEEDSFIIAVAGQGDVVKTAEQQVKQIVERCMEEKDRKKTEIQETVPLKANPLHLKLLLVIDFPQEMMLQSRGLNVTVDEATCSITFTGQASGVTGAKLKMYETTQTFATFTLTSLPNTKMEMFKKRDVQDYIQRKLNDAKLAGAWEVDDSGDGKLDIIAQTSEAVHKVAQMLKSSVGEQFRDFDQESLPLFSSKEWKTLVDTLVKQRGDTVSIDINENEQKIHILVTDNIQSYVVEEVNNFIKNKTQYQEIVKYPKGVQRFLTKYADKDIRCIEDKYSAHGVKMMFQDDSLDFLIKGTKEGLEAVKVQLDVLADNVKHATHLFGKPGIAKLLLSDRGDQHIMNIENTERCIIEREVDGEEMTMFGKSNLSKATKFLSGKPMVLATVDLGNERTLYIVQGDITEMTVDAIVNAANGKLEHFGGLAAAIVNAGGQCIQEDSQAIIESEGDIMPGDVTFTQAGNLSCRIVIHAVGPLWTGGSQGEEDILHEAVMSSLETANNQELTSIAIPAISTGIYKYPVPQATKCIVQAIQKYFESVPGSHVKDVYVCDNNAKTANEFKAAVSEQLGPLKIPTEGRAEATHVKGRYPESSKTPAHRRRKDSHSTSPEHDEIPSATRRSKIKIKIVHGELAKQKAHVLCNIADKALDLDHGTVSKSLHEAGGSILQHECSTRYPDGIDYGEIAVTQGGDLQCVSVYHTCLPNWSQGNGEVMLRKVIDSTLAELCKNSFTSIAYPALGAGNLRYPRHTVAKVMFEAIQVFGEKNHDASVQEVLIVLHVSDIDTIKAFQAQELKINFAEGSNVKLRSVSQLSKQGSFSDKLSEKDTNKVISSSEPSEVYQMGRVTFTIKNGDITKEKSDVIVNSTNVSLNLKEGEVSQAILRAGGNELCKELGLKASNMKKHGVAVTTAKGLPAEYIVHVSGDFFRHDWKRIILKCFKEASAIPGITSVAFPVLGTGQRKITSKGMAVLFVDAITEYEKSLQKGDVLSDIRVIIFQKEMYGPFTEKIKQVTSGAKKGWFGKLGDYIFGATPEAVLQETAPAIPTVESVAEVTLHFFSFEHEHIEHAISKIESTYDESYMERVKTYEVFKNLEAEWCDRIYNLKSFGVKVDYNTRLGRVRLRGIGPDVLVAAEALQQIFLQIKEKDIENQEAMVLSKRVQWSYIDEKNDKVPYDPPINKIIEDAFKRKLPMVKFPGDEDQLIIVDFHQMVEYPATDKTDTVAILREEQTKGESFESPPYWVPMTSDCELMPVQSGTKEWGEINGRFYSTLGTGPPRIIDKIERCQTRFLWQQFAAKKKQMDKQNPGHQNEQQLWHGTDSAAIRNICQGGYNRRYAKNAKAFGEGTYFSVKASYASQNTYSAPDDQGLKYMFLARVLTGFYTLGKPELKLPPVRDTQKNILFDSVVDSMDNPEMFVIFHDTQAYPEYLITFH